MEISALATPVDGDLPNRIHLYTFPDINPKNTGLCSFVDNSLKGQFKLWAQGVNLTAVMIFLLLIVRGQKQTCLLRFYSWCSSFIISKNIFFFLTPGIQHNNNNHLIPASYLLLVQQTNHLHCTDVKSLVSAAHSHNINTVALYYIALYSREPRNKCHSNQSHTHTLTDTHRQEANHKWPRFTNPKSRITSNVGHSISHRDIQR